RNNIDKNKRSWHTKDWKERRKSIIKDYCEICNSRESLTLQHQFHPQNFYQQKNAEINSHRHEWEKIDINKDDFYEYVINNFEITSPSLFVQTVVHEIHENEKNWSQNLFVPMQIANMNLITLP